ncbi:MAG: PAS domain S-box protein [Dehalococcoidia bacterium]
MTPCTFAEFFERAPLGFAVWRLDSPDDAASFRLLACNAAAAQLTGLTSERLHGKTMGELHGVIQPGISSLYLDVLRSGGARDLGEFASDDGSRIFLVRAFALPDNCLGVAFEDVAERRRSELALRASESMKAALLDAIPDLTVRFRKDGEILDARHGRESLGFLPASSLVGSNGFELAPPGAAETMKRHVQAALESGNVQTYEYAVSVDGRTLYREVRVAPAGPDEVLAIFRDITGRKRSEEALRASEERFRMLAENAQDIVFRFRLTEPRGYEYVSPAVTAMSGYAPEQYYADPEFAVKHIHADDLPRFRDMVEHGHTGSMELRWVRSDGSVIWTEQRNTPIYDDTGAAIAVEGIVRDVTERKRAEEELRQSEERFRLLAENAQDIIFRLRLVEPIGFEYVSPAMATLTGYSPEECYRDPNFAATIVHPDDQAAYRRMIWERQTGRIELRWVRKDGSVIYIEQRSTPVYDSRGRTVAIEGVVRNITDRVRAEETLRESEERFRLLAENAQDMIFRYRIAEPRGYEYVGPVVTAMAGYTPDQYYADPDFASKVIHPDDRETLDRMLAELQEAPIELRWICKDGSTIWTEQRNTLIYDDAGTLVAVEGILRDVTKRKRAEEALRASEERYRLLAENAQDLIYRYRVAPDRAFDYVSPSITTLLGYTPSECYADPELFRKLVHDEDQPLVRQLILEGQSPVIAARAVRKDGSIVWTEQRNVPIYDEEGTLIAVEGIARDISERKREEEELLYQAGVLANVRDAVVSVDARFTVRTWNPAAEELYGWQAEEVIGQSAGEIFGEQLGVRDGVNALGESGSFQGELAVRRKDGAVIVVDVIAVTLRDSASQVTGYVSVARDITDRKRAEEQRQVAREELEAKVEAQIAPSSLYGLTFRELTVLNLVAAGKADKEIAAELGISPLTVHKHLTNILSKMNASSRTEAGVRAIREGLVA